MSTPTRFPFVSKGSGGPVPDLAPLLPIRLSRGTKAIDVIGLVDSGADVSVLPYSIGSQFGVDWNSLVLTCSVGGSIGRIPGKMFAVQVAVASFPPMQLVFARVQSDNVPLILGQTNFFMEFDVCFFRSQNFFQIQPRTP